MVRQLCGGLLGVFVLWNCCTPIVCQTVDETCRALATDLEAKMIRVGIGRTAVFPIRSTSAEDGPARRAVVTPLGERLAAEIVSRLGNGTRGGMDLEAELRAANRSLTLVRTHDMVPREIVARAGFAWVVTGTVTFEFVTNADRARATVSIEALPVAGGAPVEVRRQYGVANSEILQGLYMLDGRKPTWTPAGAFEQSPSRELAIEIGLFAKALVEHWSSRRVVGTVGFAPNHAGPGGGASMFTSDVAAEIMTRAQEAGVQVKSAASMEAELGGMGRSFGGLGAGSVAQRFGSQLGVGWIGEIQHPSRISADGSVQVSITLYPVGDPGLTVRYENPIGNGWSKTVMSKVLKTPGTMNGPMDVEAVVVGGVADAARGVVVQWKPGPDLKDCLRVRPVKFPKNLEMGERLAQARKDYTRIFNIAFKKAREESAPSPEAVALKQRDVMVGGKRFATLLDALSYMGELDRVVYGYAHYGGQLQRRIVDSLMDDPDTNRLLLATRKDRDELDALTREELDEANGAGTLDPNDVVLGSSRATRFLMLSDVEFEGEQAILRCRIMDMRKRRPVATVSKRFSGDQARVLRKHAGHRVEDPVVLKPGPARAPEVAGNAGNLDYAALYRRTKTGIVKLYGKAGAKTWTGTGFLIDRNHILTNEHVVNDQRELTAEFPGAKKIKVTTIAVDATLDVAVMKLASPAPAGAHAFAFASGSEVEVGRRVAVVGNPKGIELVLSVGIISSTTYPDKRGSVMYSAVTQPGSSGSPVFLLDGRVAAVCSAGLLGNARINASTQVKMPLESYGLGCPAPKVVAFLEKNGLKPRR